MVALDEQCHHNGKRPQCGRRRCKDAFGRYSNSSAASESSVSSVAGNYPNSGPTGNIPNGTTDYIWQHWQVAEERDLFGGSGSTDTPMKQFIWWTYTDECLQINLLSVARPQGLPAGAYYLWNSIRPGHKQRPANGPRTIFIRQRWATAWQLRLGMTLRCGAVRLALFWRPTRTRFRRSRRTRRRAVTHARKRLIPGYIM